jgi:hypothetical protein
VKVTHPSGSRPSCSPVVLSTRPSLMRPRTSVVSNQSRPRRVFDARAIPASTPTGEYQRSSSRDTRSRSGARSAAVAEMGCESHPFQHRNPAVRVSDQCRGSSSRRKAADYRSPVDQGLGLRVRPIAPKCSLTWRGRIPLPVDQEVTRMSLALGVPVVWRHRVDARRREPRAGHQVTLLLGFAR